MRNSRPSNRVSKPPAAIQRYPSLVDAMSVVALLGRP
jgi:hypothetical protein